MVKVFKGFRFDPELYERFKGVAGSSGLMVTEAFERFMRVCVEAGAVRFPEVESSRSRIDAEARVLLAWLRKEQFWYQVNEEKEISVCGRLLQMLTLVESDSLRREIEEELKKS